MTDKQIMKEEQEQLAATLKIIDEQIQMSSEGLSNEQHHIIGFTEGLRGTQFNRQAMMSMYATETNRLKNLRNSPYFGRFSFINRDTGKKEILYIGKKLLTDKNHEIIVYDWRSNQCSMYYDYNIGDSEAHYNELGNSIYGMIEEKRQIQIKDAKLISVSNQDTLSDDEFLIAYLNQNADSRLKTIVATIQKEQNSIIRSSIDNNYIIQGVAGSGKTTVALHRIAYLLYNESKRVDTSNFMIIGPNKFFLDYISSALPDLDIEGITQNTFEDLFTANIKGKINIISKNEELERIMSNELSGSILKYKSSIRYLELIEKFVDFYISNKINKDIELNGTVLCKKERLQDITSKYHKNSYKDRISILSKKITKIIKDNYEDIYSNVSRPLINRIKTLSEDDPERKTLLLELSSLRENIKKGCSKNIKDYFKFVEISPIALYYSFIENLNQFTDENVKELQVETLNNLNNKRISSSDMAAILLIQFLMCGCKDYTDYSHLIIDEGQDLNIAQYYVLKRIFPNCKFDIYGDINQSIYAYQSIDNWEELNRELFANSCNYLELNKGYRNTSEISNVANIILQSMNQNIAQCVSRSGSNVSINNVDDIDITEFYIENLISLINDGYRNIAIICKNNKEVEEVFQKMSSKQFAINKITLDNSKYEEGICILPTYLSKGLEFDAVIINDASTNQYGEENIDQKLLYVAMTRALHKVIVNYSGKITKSLENIVDKDNQLVLKK